MTEKIFFDSDCVSAFLWVEEQSLLGLLYPGRIVIPDAVYRELSNPSVRQLRERIDKMLAMHFARLEHIDLRTEEYELYQKMITGQLPDHPMIGKGEASCLALAKVKGGIVASNNLRDIAAYIEEYQLEHITTGDIMVEAYEKGYITEDQGNSMWKEMLQKGRKIGARSFSEYLKKQRNGTPV